METDMDLRCSHLLLRVSDVAAARDFYVTRLGLGVVEEHPGMFACRSGDVRMSVVPGGAKAAAGAAPSLSVMLRTDDLDATIRELIAKGVRFDGDVADAPGFMRHIGLYDPDGNYLFLAEYVRNPLVAI